MARKKDKLKVELELPKNDTTLTKLYIILGIGLITGMSSMGFWFINSPFLPTPNGQPMFVNIACGWDPTFQPDLDANESCDLMKDEPQTSIWEGPKPWTKVVAEGQRFTAPGLLVEERGNYTGELLQKFSLKCEALADVEIPYTLQLWDSDKTPIAEVQKYANRGDCGLTHYHVEPGEEYSFVLYSDDVGGEKIREFTYSLHIEVYDGIPENMNNKSLWIGPEVDLGIASLRPTLFLNFFGLGIFLAFFPASYYWDGVKNRINSMEEKFPDFLRDMAEYWKGGLSMNVAVQTLSSSEYGALNAEVKKMADQLSWGVAFGDVINLFADRVGTPLVRRAISLIGEANKAGGKISDILVTAANDSREIKFLEGERKRAISSYIAVIWVSYMVFLGVIVVLGKVFIPAIASSNSGEAEEGEEGGDGSAQLGNMEIRAIDPLFFLMVFYYGVTLQAVGNGAMAGLMATGRFSSGMKHAGMMIVLALLGFNFVVFEPALIGVQPPEEIDVRAGTFQPTASIVNTAPIASNLMLLPANPSTNEDIEATYAYFDAEGHGESGTQIRWFVNGAEEPTWNGMSIISSAQTNVGDEIYFTVMPGDGIAFGSSTSLLDGGGAVTVSA